MPFDAVFSHFTPTLGRASNPEYLPVQIWPTLTGESVLDLCPWFHCPATTSWTTHPYYSHSPPPEQDGLSFIAFSHFTQRNISPYPGCPAMAILRSSLRAGKTNPQAKSFKEPGQSRTQLAPPGYPGSTKLMIAFIWGRWAQYDDCSWPSSSWGAG